MELLTGEHVQLARAALASGNPDALAALARAAASPDARMRDAARAVLVAEARSRQLTLEPPGDEAGWQALARRLGESLGGKPRRPSAPPADAADGTARERA